MLVGGIMSESDWYTAHFFVQGKGGRIFMLFGGKTKEYFSSTTRSLMAPKQHARPFWQKESKYWTKCGGIYKIQLDSFCQWWGLYSLGVYIFNMTYTLARVCTYVRVRACIKSGKLNQVSTDSCYHKLSYPWAPAIWTLSSPECSSFLVGIFFVFIPSKYLTMWRLILALCRKPCF